MRRWNNEADRNPKYVDSRITIHEYQQENKEQINENNRRYYNNHQEQMKTRTKEYYEKNKERIIDREKNRYLEKREAITCTRPVSNRLGLYAIQLVQS